MRWFFCAIEVCPFSLSGCARQPPDINIFKHGMLSLHMAGIFDFIPVISVVLLALGLIGVMVYERARSGHTERQSA